jgi:hypothetical protein
MKRLTEIAIKAFNEGSDNFGETPTGEIGMLMHEPYRDDAFYFGEPSPKTHLYYSLTIILKDSSGNECTSGVGFYVKGGVMSVCSGHIVFTVDVTPEIQNELDTAELLIW